MGIRMAMDFTQSQNNGDLRHAENIWVEFLSLRILMQHHQI